MQKVSENETIEDLERELRGIKGGQHTNGGLSFERWRARCQLADDYADRFEAAHQREVAELRECLVRRSSHLNAILQKALELRNDVPSELRKIMDECIVAEDKAIGLGVFSKKGVENEGK